MGGGGTERRSGLVLGGSTAVQGEQGEEREQLRLERMGLGVRAWLGKKELHSEIFWRRETWRTLELGLAGAERREELEEVDSLR